MDEQKVKSSFYLSEILDKEMRVEAAKLGLRFPSELIIMLWEKYQKSTQK